MTKEEAKRFGQCLLKVADFNADKNTIEFTKIALEALDQEPCEICIVKQEIKEKMIEYGFHAPDMTVTEFVEDVLHVTPKQKVGHWEYVPYKYYPKIGDWRCSECRSVVVESVRKEKKGCIPLYKYCPQCGIKIEERKG